MKDPRWIKFRRLTIWVAFPFFWGTPSPENCDFLWVSRLVQRTICGTNMFTLLKRSWGRIRLEVPASQTPGLSRGARATPGPGSLSSDQLKAGGVVYPGLPFGHFLGLWALFFAPNGKIQEEVPTEAPGVSRLVGCSLQKVSDTPLQR